MLDFDPATDPAALTRALIRRPSVTPEEGGVLKLLAEILEPAGFRCVRVDREGVPNLYARWGSAEPVFGFNGHTDVVPPGDVGAWSSDPFAAASDAEGWIVGRGAVDMKSGVAAFVSAALRMARTAPSGSIALAITGDEEGDAIHGTRALLDWMTEVGERWDVCVVGEPTSKERLGDQVKIGRRGSLTCYLTARGRQGHSAYPHAAANPLPPLVGLLNALTRQGLDEGTAHFDPSTLALTTIDVGNPANNVIPAEARATINIRYNNRHSATSLERWIRARIAAAVDEVGDPAIAIDARFKASGDAFLTPPGPFSDLAAAAIEAETGQRPAFSTGGGTSDARFVKNHCPVVEVGLVGKTMHQIDERVDPRDVAALSRIYEGMMRRMFA